MSDTEREGLRSAVSVRRVSVLCADEIISLPKSDVGRGQRTDAATRGEIAA